MRANILVFFLYNCKKLLDTLRISNNTNLTYILKGSLSKKYFSTSFPHFNVD